eukprot:TRINITY_DN1250_c0_g1_i2.p1 TRINITY_DN1250_c0_g1~~TRINITY_DN1250_c0_g1_i2.p1  ORF type:complete len:280 (+),score=92.76 TRINITY_DN1250_c0_g1_i2:25-840(+)
MRRSLIHFFVILLVQLALSSTFQPIDRSKLLDSIQNDIEMFRKESVQVMDNVDKLSSVSKNRLTELTDLLLNKARKSDELVSTLARHLGQIITDLNHLSKDLDTKEKERSTRQNNKEREEFDKTIRELKGVHAELAKFKSELETEEQQHQQKEKEPLQKQDQQQQLQEEEEEEEEGPTKPRQQIKIPGAIKNQFDRVRREKTPFASSQKEQKENLFENQRPAQEVQSEVLMIIVLVVIVCIGIFVVMFLYSSSLDSRRLRLPLGSRSKRSA